MLAQIVPFDARPGPVVEPVSAEGAREVPAGPGLPAPAGLPKDRHTTTRRGEGAV